MNSHMSSSSAHTHCPLVFLMALTGLRVPSHTLVYTQCPDELAQSYKSVVTANRGYNACTKVNGAGLPYDEHTQW